VAVFAGGGAAGASATEGAGDTAGALWPLGVARGWLEQAASKRGIHMKRRMRIGGERIAEGGQEFAVIFGAL